MILARAGLMGVDPTHILDMGIDTMGLDLYRPDGTPNPEAA